MTTLHTAEATGRPVLEFGRAWMVDPATRDKAKELGLGGQFGFWVNGRAGVLGEVDPAVAAAAIGFMAPSAVRGYWEARPVGLSAWDAALAWFGVGAAWGRTALTPMSEAGLSRLRDLMLKIIDGTDLSTGTLFAGSTLIPLPGDPAGDVTILLNVLRELRGGAHLSAAHAVGLGPHGTIMSTDDPVRGGVPWAETFGWPSPHPAPNPERRAEAETLTTVIMARSFECLSDTERGEFVELVNEARALAD